MDKDDLDMSSSDSTDSHEDAGTGAQPSRRSSAVDTIGRIRTQTRRSSVTDTIGRVRSQNGYGVSDDHDEVHGEKSAGQSQPSAEKDPFEVGWDGGDSDPLCPRSFSKIRKWIIVTVVCSASLCV
jgi:hypothetical protein